MAARCLRWTMICRHSDMRANTIKDRLRTARLKLGARTTVQAVASAIRMGLL